MKLIAPSCPVAPVRAAVAALLLAAALPLAGCGGGPDDADPVRVSVAMDRETTMPGESVTLVWRFEIAPGWHLYGTGRNDSGFPPTIDLDLPAGWIAGALQWPAPERYLADGDILDHVYHDELVLLQKVGVPADAPVGEPADFLAEVEWLGCKEACVPGRAEVPVRVPLADHPSGPRSDAWRKAHDALPRPLPADLLEVVWEGATLHVVGRPGMHLEFLPSADCGELVNLVRDGVGDGSLAIRFTADGGTVGPARGLVRVMGPDGPARAWILDHPAALVNP